MLDVEAKKFLQFLGKKLGNFECDGLNTSQAS